MRDKDIERLWSRVDRSGGPDACWPYLGPLFPNGYGVFSLNNRSVGAHRAAWEAHHGSPPDKLWVCHRCDNRSCCNPSHFFGGTAKSNHDDMASKGRRGRPAPLGEKNFHHKLVPDQVREIRAAMASGAKKAPLARRYGISRNSLYAILDGTSWGWLK